MSTLALPTLGTICALTVSIDGTVCVATQSALYVITPSAGFVLHLAGSRSETGYTDGEGQDARFNQPRGLAVASDASLLVVDAHNHRLRRVTQDGTVSTSPGGGRDSPTAWAHPHASSALVALWWTDTAQST